MKTSKINLANLPTPIYKLNSISTLLETNIYIKRDDYTGIEISGNKVRKLEFVFKELLDKGCDGVITTGGLQSNHCRATAAVANRLGLKCTLLLRGNSPTNSTGNFLLDKLFGAEIRYCTPEEYRDSRDAIMKKIVDEKRGEGSDFYIIPEGASFGVGALGYFDAMGEILKQEHEIGQKFDTIVLAVGSGGTYSGLCLANKYYNLNRRIIGFAVCDNSEYFVNKIDKINNEALHYFIERPHISKEEIIINDKYVGLGYAINRAEEYEFIKFFAKQESLILDPVYTVKAMYGLYSEIKAGALKESGNILFIHTGGLFGLFPKADELSF